jgi:hypothetical protein
MYIRMNKTIFAQFIPIIAIFLLLSQPTQVVYHSNCVLGKLAILAIVLFYTMLDKTLGAIVLVLVIVYYQSDFFEKLLNKDAMDQPMSERISYRLGNLEPMDNLDTSMQPSNADTYQSNSIFDQWSSTMSNAYNKLASPHTTVLLNDFRQEYCDAGKLKYKGMEVNAEMTEHVFPEIQFKGSKCNPCNETCVFSIIENRLKTEAEIASKSSTA